MKKGIYYILGTFFVLFLLVALSYLYFYTGKIKKLECQTSSTYFKNERNIVISFQRNLPIELEHWTIYTKDDPIEEYENLYKENVKINDFRNVQKHVISSEIEKNDHNFTLYTVVNTRWVDTTELEKIDGFYKMIFQDGKKLSHVKNYMEKSGYTCTEH